MIYVSDSSFAFIAAVNLKNPQERQVSCPYIGHVGACLKAVYVLVWVPYIEFVVNQVVLVGSCYFDLLLGVPFGTSKIIGSSLSVYLLSRPF